MRAEAGRIFDASLIGASGMRFVMLLKAGADTEAGIIPSRDVMNAIGKYNESMVRAGVLLDAAGLQASSKGARVRFRGARRTVVDGPFAETKGLIAGYWMIQVKSKAEAIEWATRCPSPPSGDEAEIELRQVFETSDFPSDHIPPYVMANRTVERHDENER
jgi:hypothetical protein